MKAKLGYMHNPDEYRQSLSRRVMLQQLLGAGLSLPLVGHGMPIPQTHGKPESRPAITPASSVLSRDDDRLLEDLERANFNFFWEQASPKTGLVKDRCNVRGPDHAVVASIAATGFGLTALCIGHKRGYISYSQARRRVLTTLRFLWKGLARHRGFFFHFANVNTGERLWDSEVSSIDTAILPLRGADVPGVLRAGFRNRAVGVRYIQSRGLVLAGRGHSPFVNGMDARDWFSPISVG